MLDMYKNIPYGITNLTLAGAIGANDTVISLSGNVANLPPAPNLIQLGDETGETILYGLIVGNDLQGCQRGIVGTAQNWASGTEVFRNLSVKDIDNIQNNIADLYNTRDGQIALSNSDFEVWNRGETPNYATGNQCGADRWQFMGGAINGYYRKARRFDAGNLGKGMLLYSVSSTSATAPATAPSGNDQLLRQENPILVKELKSEVIKNPSAKATLFLRTINAFGGGQYDDIVLARRIADISENPLSAGTNIGFDWSIYDGFLYVRVPQNTCIFKATLRLGEHPAIASKELADIGEYYQLINFAACLYNGNFGQFPQWNFNQFYNFGLKMARRPAITVVSQAINAGSITSKAAEVHGCLYIIRATGGMDVSGRDAFDAELYT